LRWKKADSEIKKPIIEVNAQLLGLTLGTINNPSGTIEMSEDVRARGLKRLGEKTVRPVIKRTKNNELTILITRIDIERFCDAKKLMVQ
jgi:hypothetical protein